VSENAASSEPGAVDTTEQFENGETLRPQGLELLSTVFSVEQGLHPSLAEGGAGGAPRGDGFAHYEVCEEIGKGGMATVYRARQVRLGREVAIKRNDAGKAMTREKFLAEARVTGLLDHPGVVPVYDLLVADGGDIALAMKLIRGRSWKEILHPPSGEEPRDLDFHLGVLGGVANAVAFAHSRNITHNDLKPANVMVGEFGEVLVVDWGMALDVRPEPSQDAVAPHRSLLHAPSGTPAYWAPELARGAGRDVGPHTDVYLLGAILYEIVSGQPPHRGGSLFTAIAAAVKEEPPPFDAGAPPGLEEICRKAMAKAPADRYPSVAAFQEALREFVKHRESLAITAAAKATLERASDTAPKLAPGLGVDADRIRVYVDLGDAASAFRQARVLWPENGEAAAGERRAVLAEAGLALDHGDLGLAEVQLSRLDPADPEVKEAAAKVAAAFVERDRSARNAVRLRRSLLAAVGAIVVGLSVGLVVLRLEHRRVEASARLANARLADVRRLADVKRLADLTVEADSLWPARIEKVAAMKTWLTSARALIGGIPRHEAYLAELRKGAVQAGNAYRFPDAESQWEHDTLEGLVAGLHDLSQRLVPDMERRVETASTLRARTIEAPRALWHRAIDEIADPAVCPAYHGLHVTPQLGLIPLGRDPESGLWEFAHVETGEAPARGPDGKLVLADATGTVLVLLPGGTFDMGTRRPDRDHPLGSPNVDPDAQEVEGPVHAVTLSPFFIAKYEITQAQWVRMTGHNPSAYLPGRVIGGRTITALNPVEQIGWKETVAALSRRDLLLPTEAQWEYAARAGSTTVYATGDRKESLQGYLNIADRYCKEHGGPGSWVFETWLEDGNVVHAPVGSYRPNAFGLHDMAGNVWEFVRDLYGPYSLPVSPGDGARQAPADAPEVFRGGGFRSNIVHARAGDRYSLYAHEFHGFDIGARAARALDP